MNSLADKPDLFSLDEPGAPKRFHVHKQPPARLHDIKLGACKTPFRINTFFESNEQRGGGTLTWKGGSMLFRGARPDLRGQTCSGVASDSNTHTRPCRHVWPSTACTQVKTAWRNLDESWAVWDWHQEILSGPPKISAGTLVPCTWFTNLASFDANQACARCSRFWSDH